MSEIPAKTAPCPICGKPSVHEARPFCSRRCAEVDLGRWLKGVYRVPGQAASDSDGADVIGDEDRDV